MTQALDPKDESATRLELAKLIVSSTAVCGKTLFPERFSLPFSTHHDRVCKILDDPSQQLVAIAAWRGFGKSSLVQLAKPAKEILGSTSDFIIPICDTFTQAQMQVQNLQRELDTNRIIKSLFPDMKGGYWAKDGFIANNLAAGGLGSLVLPRGYGQQIRGLLHGDYRPNLIIVDDLENKENVFSEEQRQKRLEYLYSDVMGAVSRSRKDWRIIYIGTVLHDDSLLSNLLDDPEWSSVRLELFDDNGISNWPEQMSNDDITKLIARYRSQGLLNELFKEYRNLSQSSEEAPFAPEHFRYFEPEDLKSPNVQFVMMVDPAKTTGARSCDTAIVVCGVDLTKNRIYVADIFADKLHPNEIYETIIALAKQWNVRTCGVEYNGLNEFIEWPLKNFLKSSGFYMDIIELKPRKGPSQYVPKGSSNHGKDARIGASLVPLYRQGLIYHNKTHPMTFKLESQLCAFPTGKHKDVIDALAYISEMMHIGERYMQDSRLLIKSDVTQSAIDRAFLNCKNEDEALAALIASDRRMSIY